MGGGFEHPLPGPGVEVVAGGGARLGPEGDVLAVRRHGEPGCVEAAGMRAEGRLHHGQHSMGGDLDAVAETVEVLHHPLDRRHHAATGRPRTPRSLEQWFGQGHVSLSVRHSSVDEGDVGHEWRNEPDRAEGSLRHGEAGVGRHRRALERTRHQSRQSARRGFESLREGQDRPVLDLDPARGVGLLEDRVRRVGRESVSGVGRHDLAHHGAAEEQRAERAQAEHDEREPGVLAPMLAGHLPSRRAPSAVTTQHLHRVPGAHVMGDGVLERHMFHVVSPAPGSEAPSVRSSAADASARTRRGLLWRPRSRTPRWRWRIRSGTPLSCRRRDRAGRSPWSCARRRGRWR